MLKLFGERIGRPQIVAASLLFLLLLQCVWFLSRFHLSEPEGFLLQAGGQQLRGGAMAVTPQHSPFTAILAAIMEGVQGPGRLFQLDNLRWLIRLPFLFMGVMLGGSLWYVARRLYGNKGGYVALLLYIFSPLVVTRSAQVLPDIAAAWGSFGLVFTGIAVAHTLYAPREVILWNWKRIVLMGVSIGIAVASQYSMALLLLPVLCFMLWLAPVRRGAAAAILFAACVVGFVVLTFSFVPHVSWLPKALLQAHWVEFQPRQLFHLANWKLVGRFFLDSGSAPALLLLVSLVTYVVWPKTRYFGTTAPLLAGAFCVLLAFVMPIAGGYTFLIVSLPFWYVFIAGMAADLLESRYSDAVLGLLAGAILVHATLGIAGLVQLTYFTS